MRLSHTLDKKNDYIDRHDYEHALDAKLFKLSHDSENSTAHRPFGKIF